MAVPSAPLSLCTASGVATISLDYKPLNALHPQRVCSLSLSVCILMLFRNPSCVTLPFFSMHASLQCWPPCLRASRLHTRTLHARPSW